MSWKECRPKNIDEFCDLLFQFSEASKFACRGHSKIWGDRLIPSLERILERKIWLTEGHRSEVEFISMYRFQGRARTYLHRSETDRLEDLMGTLMLMQHYGAPTRLLDWSRSPWVASYFCAMDQSHVEEEGEIWIFDYDKLEAMIYKDKRFDELVRTKWHQIVRSRRFPEIADSWIATYTPSPKSPRMIAQQSLFTMAAPKADHGKMIDQYLEDGLYSKCGIYVSPEVRRRLRRRILQMNMTAAALFPGIEGIGQTIREGLEITERGLAT